MTHEEMAALLAQQGWSVRPPPDLRTALPWRRLPDGTWTRHWEDSTVFAAHVESGAQMCGDCGKQHKPIWATRHKKRRPRFGDCECGSTARLRRAYAWTVQLVGQGTKRYRDKGCALTLVEAKAQCDKMLLQKLEIAREERLASLGAPVDADNTCLSLEKP